jgi:hypothetical protein
LQAEKLDEQLQQLTNEVPLTFDNGEPAYSYPLGSWAYHEKLKQIRHIIQLGFELAIYAPEELAGMYWYLAEICFQHRRHIDRIRAFVLAGMRRSDADKEFERTITVLNRHTMWLVATETFALALHALYVFFERQGVLPHAASKNSYSSSRLRYELRMKPFLSISLPELLPFDKYEAMVALEGDSDAQTLERASNAIGEARKAWEKVLASGPFLGSRDADKTIHRPAIESEWQRNTKDSYRSCIGASVAIQKASNLLKTKKSAKTAGASLLPIKVDIPDVDTPQRWHDWWAVPRISEVESG